MLNGIHFLLTYTCLFECDHCFLYSGPRADGVFTREHMENILADAAGMNGIEWIFFEGGEPFLYHPLLMDGIQSAASKGFQTGIVTNAYWATSEDDAALWLKPLRDLKLSTLVVSDDTYHFGNEKDPITPATHAAAAAEKLGIPVSSICIEAPVTDKDMGTDEKGEPVTGGGPKFKGRAAEKLTAGLSRVNCASCKACHHEELEHPKRVHIDPFGNVHACQGLIIGNTLDMPLSEIMSVYSVTSHPIIGPLVTGGPMLLAEMYKVKTEETYVDECHMCYEVRRALIDRFPRYLGPRQVYGLD
ncbi:MAG: 4Fe-4S cluster-binding domain-containing protein [Desulfobacteraceae bacterium]|nr:4Fe-4S cluster-binding domain-containing protein [Desulfobacteraceae bacterium]